MRIGLKGFACFLLLLIEFTVQGEQTDTICGHKVNYDLDGRILGWYKPEIQGAVFDKVITLASEFILEAPIETKTNLPMYYVTCCFSGPHMTPGKNFEARESWMHNPACFFAGSTQSLAVQYYPYSGDNRFLKLVKEMLDYQLEHGTTPDNFKWGNVPYASSDPLAVEYQGATRWNGKRGDGLHGIEPDKIGEMGNAYLQFYKITEEKRYLDAAIYCADALAGNIWNVKAEQSDEENYEVTVYRSPWPFRVNAKSGKVIDQYCSNVLEPVKLLNELLRIRNRIELPEEKFFLYKKAAKEAWAWLFAKNGPMRTFIWNAYFEDVECDPLLQNRVQITPVELAKYLSENPERDKNRAIHVPALLYYSASAFKNGEMDFMNEQLFCFRPMGSHTARYGSACALWYEQTGDEWFKDQAFRYMNAASYTTRENGVVSTGPDYSASWFSDGYSDYIRHFLDAMAAIPEWAPEGENHLLRSSSVIQSIQYQEEKIEYTTFDMQSNETLKLVHKPTKVMAEETVLKESHISTGNGWYWQELKDGGVLKIKHNDSRSIEIIF